jgi:cysteine dioxygenase
MGSRLHNLLLTTFLQNLSEIQRFTPENLRDAVAQMPLATADVLKYVRFDADNYTRTLIYQNDRLQVLCLGWLPGQGSPIHDHAASVCAVRVLQGFATERLFEHIHASSPYLTRVWKTDEVTANPGTLVHSIRNESSDPMITIHAYAPPLVPTKAIR